MLPNLHVFNASPIDKYTKNEKGARVDAVDEEEQKHRDSKHQGFGETKDSNLDNARELDMKRKRNREKANENGSEQEALVQGNEERDSIKKKKRDQAVNEDLSNLKEAADLEESKGKKLKKKGHKDDDTKVKKILHKKKQQSELDIIDDADTSFLELLSDDKVVDAEDDGRQRKLKDKASQDTKLSCGIVNITSSKAKKRSTASTLPLLPVDEIGVGGPSTWD